MNLSQFFAHWKIAENPFRSEEARYDTVFARMAAASETPNEHSDFEKILGDLARPSTAIVFGEKGSGKTAIRLQIASRIAQHNRDHPEAKTFLIPYDELNAFLDRFHARHLGGVKKPDPSTTLGKIRLVDHLDAMLAIGTGRIVNALLGGPGEPAPADLGDRSMRTARSMSSALKTDLLLLASAYDQHDVQGRRTGSLRRHLHMAPPRGVLGWWALTWFGWLPAAAVFAWLRFFRADWVTDLMLRIGMWIALGLLVLWAAALLKTQVWDRLHLRRLGQRMYRQMRMIGRPPESYAASLTRLDSVYRTDAYLPMGGSEETRYTMLDRLRRVSEHFGFAGLLVVVDRVDEPTLVNGEADRMRAVVWPMLNNKFLQQTGLGVKMLLPIELRHLLFKESSAFFQEARLDKQNMVERLSWTGPMLYDLCNARLAACRTKPVRTEAVDGEGEPSAGAAPEPITVLDLFAEDVTRQDLVDALDQMHQPRDAFKFVYRCLTEHCSNVTAEEGAWRVPRLVLDSVRRAESDRVQQLERGIRPA